MNKKTELTAVAADPDAIDNVIDILGGVHFLPGERLEDYESLRDAVVREVKPSNLFEQLAARELLSLMWEERRLRRLRDAHINSNLDYGVKTKLNDLVENDDASLEEMERLNTTSHRYAIDLTHDYLARDPVAVSKVSRIFSEAKESLDEIVSGVFVRHIKTMQDFEILIASNVQHRNRLIADIEGRKERRQRIIEKLEAIVVNG